MAKTRQGRRDVAALEARRFEAARLFARGTGQAAVMRALGVSRQTAHQWYHRWRRGGRQGLKAVGRLGRKPRLDKRRLGCVETARLQGPRRHGFATELWTLPRVATVIARLTGVRYHPGHVWYLLRGLQWSLQRPTRRARERDEAAIRQWVSRRWPAVKKRPPPAGLARLRGRKRVLAATRRPAHVGPARAHARPDPHPGHLAASLGGRGAGVPLGRAAHAVLFPDAPGELHRCGADRFPAAAQAPLSGPPRAAPLGRAGCPQEPRHASLRGPPARLADG